MISVSAEYHTFYMYKRNSKEEVHFEIGESSTKLVIKAREDYQEADEEVSCFEDTGVSW